MSGRTIRGIGEEFAANPFTRMGSMEVTIDMFSGRSGYGSQLSLANDSGAGGGLYSYGWSLSLLQITHETDKGPPDCDDAGESNVFLSSGLEGMVPVLDGNGTYWSDTRRTDDVVYRIHCYRPRIEEVFDSLERWANVDDPRDVHWRSVASGNIPTLSCKDANSRIVDPNDPRHTFSWLTCETRDHKISAATHEYKAEGRTKVDLSRALERNRGDRNSSQRSANRYPKRVVYCSRMPLLDNVDNAGPRLPFLTDHQIGNAGWLLGVVFDYSERHADTLKLDDAGPWPLRDDPFSPYLDGFEVRTYRMGQWVLMLYRVEGEEGVGADRLVRSTHLKYSPQQAPNDAPKSVYTLLLAVTLAGYKRHNAGDLTRNPPPVESACSQPMMQDTAEDMDTGSLENPSIGMDGAAYRWTDLHERNPGTLTYRGGAWLYKGDLSQVPGNHGDSVVQNEPKCGLVGLVTSKPNLVLADGQAQFVDLDGDGNSDALITEEEHFPYAPFFTFHSYHEEGFA
jgi:hypothetical protein